MLLLVIQLNLGQLPAIAGNTPGFKYFNLLLNINSHNIQKLLLYYHMKLWCKKIKFSWVGIEPRSSQVEIRRTNHYTTNTKIISCY